jgi:hypothetical protein
LHPLQERFLLCEASITNWNGLVQQRCTRLALSDESARAHALDINGYLEFGTSEELNSFLSSGTLVGFVLCELLDNEKQLGSNVHWLVRVECPVRSKEQTCSKREDVALLCSKTQFFAACELVQSGQWFVEEEILTCCYAASLDFRGWEASLVVARIE